VFKKKKKEKKVFATCRHSLLFKSSRAHYLVFYKTK
jgi:hypothetical protein